MSMKFRKLFSAFPVVSCMEVMELPTISSKKCGILLVRAAGHGSGILERWVLVF